LEKQVTSLTPFERLSLMNQLSILKHLDPENAEHYNDHWEILHSGYTIRYGEIFQDVYEEMPLAECEYVYEVLNMHRTLINSFNGLEDKQGLTADDVRFRGFDGNNETKNWAFAEYLQKKGLWKETLVGGMNSHSMMTMDRYPQMLERYEPIKQKILDSHLGNWQLTAPADQDNHRKRGIMKRTAHLFVMLALICTGSAQHVEPWSATRELRMKEASRLHGQLSAMDKQVPYLSPAEQKWLDGELNSANGKFTDRYVRATESQEYAISTAKSSFALVLIPLNSLRSLKLACKDEVLMWTEVASRLPDGQLWQSVDSLVKRKMISRKSAEDFGNSFLAANATLRTQAILDGVVIPYLKDELNCQ
jgi:hypothetical protein